MTRLLDPLVVAGRTAPSRVLFGPHETNLGRGRAISERHVAHYARRAAGGAGIVVTETASVHPSDHPYERAPLAADCGPGWADVVTACRPHGALVLASLGHTGAQGTSAHAQAALWGPSAVPDVATREIPVAMEQADVDALVAGFAAGARTAVRADVDGVEIDAGARSLLRQFASGLTNTRADRYGTDRQRLLREVLAAVRAQLGPGRVLALRLACDEEAPWAGITPSLAVEHVRELAPLVDLLVVVRGSGMAPSAYRPDGHTPPGFNADLTRAMRAAAGGTPVVLQGSVVDVPAAQRAVDDGVADAVEMTRAQLADADLVAKARAGVPVRPCTLCNQACQVRDVRNPLVSCVADPSDEAAPPDGAGRRVTVVGGGPAGLEAARVLASAGADVRLVERSGRLGGSLRLVAALPGRSRFELLGAWLAGEVTRLGVRVELGTAAVAGHVVATGARRQAALTAADVLAGAELPAGPVIVLDPAGGPVGVGVAELLAAAGREVTLVTPDEVAGARLGGDLAPANARLARAGVRRETSSVPRRAGDGVTVLADRWTGTQRSVTCAVVVDAGPGLPGDVPPGTLAAGDVVAPRTVLEAVLEGRRSALTVLASPQGQRSGATSPAAP